jgi:hypothetical protein
VGRQPDEAASTHGGRRQEAVEQARQARRGGTQDRKRRDTRARGAGLFRRKASEHQRQRGQGRMDGPCTGADPKRRCLTATRTYVGRFSFLSFLLSVPPVIGRAKSRPAAAVSTCRAGVAWRYCLPACA